MAQWHCLVIFALILQSGRIEEAASLQLAFRCRQNVYPLKKYESVGYSVLAEWVSFEKNDLLYDWRIISTLLRFC